VMALHFTQASPRQRPYSMAAGDKQSVEGALQELREGVSDFWALR
jgi:hypothetical protein